MTPMEPGLAAVTALSVNLKQEYNNSEDVEWNNHELEWIRSKPSARIGKIGRLLVKGLCEHANLQVKTKGYSLIIGTKIIGTKNLQVRFSTGWSGGDFKFEQLRNEQYDAVFCLGITPIKAFAWFIPKDAIFSPKGDLLKKKGLTTQHKGKGGSDTAWINVDVQDIPDWMSQYGDSIAIAIEGLKAFL